MSVSDKIRLMIDTHAHLNFPQLANQIDQIVENSKKAGLTGIIIASSNLKDSFLSVELAKKYPDFLYASVGIHPQNTDPENGTSVESQLVSLEKLLTTNIVAIGETGLDFSPAPPGEKDRTKEEQEQLFKGQMTLALKYKLPLVIHAREAVDEAIDLLSNSSTLKGVFHCYAGGKKRVAKVLNLPGSWYFGFDGNLTYDAGLQNILTFIPKDRILIETDSPLLAPVPHRGEINTPVFLPFIQQKVNEIFKEDLAAQILENTKKLFSL